VFLLTIKTPSPKSIRFDADEITFLDKMETALKESRLPISCTRTDLVKMFISRVRSKGNNELFLMLLENLEYRNAIDNHTVRGVVDSITGLEFTEHDFKSAIKSIEELV